MSKIITPKDLNKSVPIICNTCNNYGYYKVGTANKKEQMMMFCACEIGGRLRTLSIEWRLEDVKTMSDNILPRLKIIKSSLYEPSKANKYIEELVKDIETVLEKTKEALKWN